MKECNSQSLRDAAFSYTGMGYKILSLAPRDKKVIAGGWSDPEYQDSPIHWETKGNENNNIGMALKRNNLFIIDIDNRNEYYRSVKALETPLVELTGVDEMFYESDTIGISSGRAGSEKYVFTIPDGFADAIKYRRINWQNKAKEFHSVVEFRCGDGFQDVMPPSIHPSGTKYQFTHGDYALPMPADLLCLMYNFDQFKATLLAVNPDYVPPVRIKNKSRKPYEGDDYAQMWCDKEYLPTWLTKYGYVAVGNNRYLSPHSTSSSPGIVVFDDGKKFWSHGASDPFCDGSPHSAYDLLVHYEFNGNYKEAWKYVLRDLGVGQAKNTNRSPQWW